MTHFCMVVLQHTYRYWRNVLAKKLQNTTTKNKQLILKFLTINTTRVVQG